MDELLALIGQHWRLVLLYPGGLTALGALLLIAPGRGTALRRSPLHGRDVLSAAMWLLVITLLPLPQAGWPYDLDLPLFLLAVETPFWFRALHENHRVDDLAAPLNVYPLLAIAVAALGQGAGSLVLHDINRSAGLLHWIGLGAWAIALPPLLGLGPWRSATSDVSALLRRVAHMGLLLAAALPANETTWRLSAALGFLAIALPLAALDRWWRGDAQRWIGWQPWLCAALALLLVVLSAQSLAARIG